MIFDCQNESQEKMQLFIPIVRLFRNCSALWRSFRTNVKFLTLRKDFYFPESFRFILTFCYSNRSCPPGDVLIDVTSSCVVEQNIEIVTVLIALENMDGEETEDVLLRDMPCGDHEAVMVRQAHSNHARAIIRLNHTLVLVRQTSCFFSFTILFASE